MFNFKKFSACIAAICMLFVMGAGVASVKPFNNLPGVVSAYAFENQSSCDEMVVFINRERESAGLKPLKIYPFACGLTAVRAKESSILFSHTRPDESVWYSVILDAGVPCMGLGENLAFNQESADNAVKCAFEQFMASPTHKANIMKGDFTHVGIGIYNDGDRYYFAQIFISWDSVYEGEYIPIDLGKNVTQVTTQTAVKPVAQTTTQVVTQQGTQALTQPEIEKYKKGDVDGNGVIDAVDAAIVLTYYASMQTGSKPQVSDEFLYAADVDCNHVIDAADAALILQYYSCVSTGKKLPF